MKERFELAASSLGAYFGVGFNTPEEQFDYDLGLKENVFDEDSLDRMELGKILEDAALNYAEYKLKIVITNRNVEVVTGFDGKVRMKIDGECIFNGEPTIVENKVSNSASKRFTEDLGYYLQCQAYMEQSGYKQTLLLGLYQGKFIWKLIHRDEPTIAVMRQVVDFVWGVLNGLEDRNDFPYDLTDKWAERTPLEPVADEELTDDDRDFIEELAGIKSDPMRKAMDDREKEITDYLKKRFKNQKVEGDGYTCSISTVERAGDLDKDALKDYLAIHLPGVDLEQFKKPASSYNKVDIRFKKK